MGEWKAPLSLRVQQDFRRELEDFANIERRTVRNVGEVLLEWAWEQLKVAGSIDRRLKFKIRSAEGEKQLGGNPRTGARL